MRYLVDSGRLVWVLASTPQDAAQMAALDSRPTTPAMIIVHELRAGYRFPFLFLGFPHERKGAGADVCRVP